MAKEEILCDFHVHTNYSDGKMPMRDVIDLYGRAGFGAIAITDHVPEESTLIGKAARYLDQVLTPEKFNRYLFEMEEEAERALTLYDMVVIPGVELSKNSVLNHRSAHVLGLGIREFFFADGEIRDLCQEIKRQAGVSIAAHPVHTQKMEKQTYFLWDKKEELRNSFDAWEVASGPFVFPEVASEKLPMIASSDLHRPSQLVSWKTVVYAEKKEEAILEAIRKQSVNFIFWNQSP